MGAALESPRLMQFSLSLSPSLRLRLRLQVMTGVCNSFVLVANGVGAPKKKYGWPQKQKQKPRQLDNRHGHWHRHRHRLDREEWVSWKTPSQARLLAGGRQRSPKPIFALKHKSPGLANLCPPAATELHQQHRYQRQRQLGLQLLGDCNVERIPVRGQWKWSSEMGPRRLGSLVCGCRARISGITQRKNIKKLSVYNYSSRGKSISVCLSVCPRVRISVWTPRSQRR